LFLGRNHTLFVCVHTFSTERCLLSDRGLTSPVAQNPHLVCDFNLGAQAFIRYAFIDNEAVHGGPLPTTIVRGLSRGPKQVHMSYCHDDLAALDLFHRRAIEQSFSRVFCSGLSPYGVTVAGGA
jgi:hypothetical protein